MATVTAGNSTAVTIAGDQTVSVSVNHNNSGRIVFTPTNASAINGDGGTGVSFGPTAMSKTYGPFNVAGTLTIYCDVGTVTYTVNDSYFPNNVGIGTSSPGYRLDVYKAGAASILAARSDTQAALRAEVGTCAADLQTFSTYGELRTATNHPLLFSTNAIERMRLDTAGNFGLGVNPSAWGTLKALDVNTRGAFAGGTGGAYVAYNCYYDGANWIYKNNHLAAVYSNELGDHKFLLAATGITGATATMTQAMTLTSAGNLSLVAGTTSMTNGFFYIPAAAGIPSGTPTAITGTVPMYYDTTNNKFYVYNGAWKGVTLA